MADGRTHYAAVKLGWFIIGPATLLFLSLAIYINSSEITGISVYLFCLFLPINYSFCRYIDPDLDQLGLTSSEGRMMRDLRDRAKVLGLFGAIWVSFWMPYAELVLFISGGHRTWLSHGWGIGTIGRMLYFNLLLVLPLLSLLFNLGSNAWGWKSFSYELYLNVWFIPYIISQAIAWFTGDTFHLLLDNKKIENIFRSIYGTDRIYGIRRRKAK